MKKIIAIALCVLAIATLLTLCGCNEVITKEDEYQRACEALQVTVNKKTNQEDNGDELVVAFDFNFKNHSPYKISELNCYFMIEDCNGKSLTSGDGVFSTTIHPNIDNKVTFTWTMPTDENSKQIWNSNLEALKISFKITEVYIDEYMLFSPDYNTKVIKPIDGEYLDRTYKTASDHLSLQEYDRAIELFKKIISYKDSKDKINMANYQRDNAITTKYNEAVTALEGKKYDEAITLIKEVDSYKLDLSIGKIEELRTKAIDYGFQMLFDGAYSNIIDFFGVLGYTADMSDWEMPYDIYWLISTAQEGLSGVYTSIIGLGLTEFTVPDGTTTISENAFANCEELTKVTLPDSVTTIGEYAFYGCISLKSINIPNNVSSIGAGAFENCTALSEVKFPASLTVIGDRAFANCTSIKELALPSKLNTLGKEAFCDCKGINTLTIPESVTTVGYGALAGCHNLKELNLPAISGFRLNAAYGGHPSLTRVTVNGGGEMLSDEFFADCQVTEITLSDGIITIGQLAFKGCEAAQINLPKTLTAFGYGAFKSSQITDITLPAGVTAIPKQAFAYSSIKKLTVHNGIKSIGLEAFCDCNLEIEYLGTKDEWESITKDSLWNYAFFRYTIVCTDATYIYDIDHGSWLQ